MFRSNVDNARMCSLCLQPACLISEGQQHFCMLHYTLDNYMKHTETSEASIYDKLEYEKQSVGLESVWKESIVDLITNMMELQKQEEDEFRTSVHAKVSAQKKRPIPVIDDGKADGESSNPYVRKKITAKPNLWRTDVHTLDKTDVLRDINEREDEIIQMRKERGGAVQCIKCGSSDTMLNSRSTTGSTKCEIWGNKDEEHQGFNITCRQCAHVGESF